MQARRKDDQRPTQEPIVTGKRKRSTRPSAPPPASATPSAGRSRLPQILLAAAGVAIIGMLVWLWTRESLRPPEDTTTARVAPAAYVSEAQCADCHATAAHDWQGSHHDLAMQEASGSTILGDFNDAVFTKDGVRTRFFMRAGRHWINTDGPDGRLTDYEVKYTFGVEPLQQYLLELDRGRLQAFTVAWDTQRKRWFHLYPQERIDHRDELHWTRLSQNWNFMCAECHSTDLKKNFDPATQAYRTTWKQIDVGCQACHGPASTHLAAMQDTGDGSRQTGAAGTAARQPSTHFPVDLSGSDATPQIEMCARCHSRRAVLWGDYRHGRPFMDTHLPSLLEAPLYFADGQIDGEVYEYASFLQSKMHQKGLRCSDCHNPHSLQTRAPGNALCASCHNASAPAARPTIDVSGLKRGNYDSPEHHFHQAGQPGSLCVDCHAPQRTYMVVDPRRDHSFRIPRPDLSVRMGTPNACNVCHDRKSPQWAADAVAKWYGPERRQETTHGELLWAGSTRQPNGEAALLELANDRAQPAIARATALQLLQAYPGSRTLEALHANFGSADPMLRLSALRGLDMLPPERRAPLSAPFLADPVRAVRIEATALTAQVPATALSQLHRSQLAAGIREFQAAQLENADQPSAWLNLGNLYASIGDSAAAASEFQRAIRMDPAFVPAYVNLADLQGRTGEDEVAIATLQAAPPDALNSAAMQHALGLALTRVRRYDEALASLRAAARGDPENPRYAFVYAVALHDTGRPKQGIAVLEDALRRHPHDRSILSALADYLEEAGDTAAVRKYRAELEPD